MFMFITDDMGWDGVNPDPSYCHQQIREVLESGYDSFIYRHSHSNNFPPWLTLYTHESRLSSQCQPSIKGWNRCLGNEMISCVKQ